MSDIIPNVVVSMPSQLFTLARKFQAASNGRIFIGKIDTDPTLPENQIQVYLENEDGSHIPVPQPLIINQAGFPVYNGQIAKFVTVEGHSMAVYNSYGVKQFYYPNVLKYDPDRFSSSRVFSSRNNQVSLSDIGTLCDWGGVGDGMTDNSSSLDRAIKSGETFLIPQGDFLFKSGSISLNGYDGFIYGFGNKSKLILDMDDGDTLFVSDDWVRRLTIENIICSANPGSPIRNNGFIDIKQGLRGITLSNIWLDQIARGVKTGDKIWGKLAIENFHHHYFNQYAGDDSYGIKSVGGSNTVFAKNIEIIGSLNHGAILNGGVITLDSFNIAGSSGVDLMKNPLSILSSSTVKVTNGWIEEVDPNGLGVGHGKAVNIIDSYNVEVDTVNIASGSIYVQNSDVDIERIAFAQNEAGIKHDKNSNVNVGKIYHRGRNNNLDDTDGYVRADYEWTAGNVYHKNKFKLNSSVSHKKLQDMLDLSNFVATNSSVVISNAKDDETTLYSAKKILAGNFQGVTKKITGLKPSVKYTISLQVGLDENSNAECIQINSGAIGVTYSYCLTKRTTYTSDTISIIITSSASGEVEIRAVCKMKDSSQTGVFYIAGASISEGFVESDFVSPVTRIDNSPLITNPYLSSSQLPFIASNSTVTIASSNDFATGVSSRLISGGSFQGVIYEISELNPEQTYSLLSVVKRIPEFGQPEIFIIEGERDNTAGIAESVYPNNKYDFSLISSHIKPSSAGVIKALIRTNSSGNFQFIIDSIQLYSGIRNTM
ncbi:TPA: phage tailspike protein [Proteus mirabilis]|nr:hypothetical protein [Proteus mirabilis]MDU3453277.1 phage tailspike protein [Proteus mirabilis]MDU3488680.1 phage tailspike protein [Proteus mirabilis]HEJ9736125.1 hypothetical protein [Proteus mirabilis]HEK2679566.1 hypothetical protein [Proteus mirabilis]